jgi:hypothetical protein
VGKKKDKTMKPKTIGMFIFISILTIIWSARIHGKIPGKENDALRTLFNDTGGLNWRHKENWKKAPGTEHTWYGITLNSDNTTVLKIELPYNNLRGTPPPDLGALANLTTLDLSNNGLSGPIPRWLQKLGNLRKLRLGNNRFTGSIPSWLGNLKNLEELVLEDNMLEGSIPAALGRLSKLKVLRLGHNRLTGEIPAALGQLKALLNNRSDFKWNGLYTQNTALNAFLNRKQTGKDWESTQTVAPSPGDIAVVEFSEDSITIRWKPVEYTGDRGGYRVFYRKEGQPYRDDAVENTEDKTVSQVTLKNLEKSTKYFFKIQTWTGIHGKNRNRIESSAGKEFPAATRGLIISGTVKKYPDLEQSRQEALPGVQITASNRGGAVDSDKHGNYSLNVMPGWTGIITPSKKGFDFSPPNREYPPVKIDISGQDYTAAATTIISGKVTYKGKAVAGVQLTFSSREGETSLVTTDENGNYQHIVPYDWSGAATPQKTGYGFEPGEKEYPPVKSHLQGQDYTVRFPGISGRVTGRKGKTGIPGVKLVFSNVDTDEFIYLNDNAVTDSDGN